LDDRDHLVLRAPGTPHGVWSRGKVKGTGSPLDGCVSGPNAVAAQAVGQAPPWLRPPASSRAPITCATTSSAGGSSPCSPRCHKESGRKGAGEQAYGICRGGTGADLTFASFRGTAERRSPLHLQPAQHLRACSHRPQRSTLPTRV
jgi:hypothetical protein